MAVSEPSALDLIHGDTSVNKRYSIWLWLYLQRHEAAGFELASCNSVEMQKITTDYLSGRGDILLGTVQDEMKRALIPHRLFNWITDDPRLIGWLLPKLEGLSSLRELKSLPRLAGRDLALGITDLWSETILNKAAALDDLHYKWRKHKTLDHQFKWFTDKKEERNRCEYAWRWIEKNDRKLLFHNPRPFENHRELLAFFDTLDLRERERKDIAQSIRQSWNRLKYLERLEDKKQYNFILSTKLIDLLDRIAEEHGMKRPAVLEHLIAQEYEQRRYLPERGAQ